MLKKYKLQIYSELLKANWKIYILIVIGICSPFMFQESNYSLSFEIPRLVLMSSSVWLYLIASYNVSSEFRFNTIQWYKMSKTNISDLYILKFVTILCVYVIICFFFILLFLISDYIINRKFFDIYVFLELLFIACLRNIFVINIAILSSLLFREMIGPILLYIFYLAIPVLINPVESPFIKQILNFPEKLFNPTVSFGEINQLLFYWILQIIVFIIFINSKVYDIKD